jgi:ElaB/YqjD/DUF883 family membrane-anchored ribosome-binding protein
MDVSKVDVSRFVDQAAKTAHETIGRVHGRMAKMEEGLGGRVEASSEQLIARFESRAQAFGKYIEANPVKATMVAFGIGMWASRMFKAMEHVSPETDPGAKAAPTGKAQEPEVGKAA